jgi:hypothetical protein
MTKPQDVLKKNERLKKLQLHKPKKALLQLKVHQVRRELLQQNLKSTKIS